MVYQPSKAIHPGVTVQRTLDSLGMTQKRLAERTGLSEKHISQIINGEASITADTAFLLQNAIGASASFWLNLDKNYRETLARLEQEEKAKEEVECLVNFPYSDLVKLGRVEAKTSRIEKVISLWQFFGVNSLKSVPHTEAVAYRRGYGKGVKHEALAAWLRCGELDAAKLNLTDFNESNLRSLLPKVRSMTQMVEKDFFAKTQELLASAGVGLVAAPHLVGTQAHGATRWIGKNPVIQLSIRRKNADTFWFTLFHELAHIFLHGKKDQFISFNSGRKSNEETEADIFAARTLIPDDAYRNFLMHQDFSENAIRNFAEQQGINPGIVVGRLKNDKWLSFGSYQHLHDKLEMKV